MAGRLVADHRKWQATRWSGPVFRKGGMDSAAERQLRFGAAGVEGAAGGDVDRAGGSPLRIGGLKVRSGVGRGTAASQASV